MNLSKNCNLISPQAAGSQILFPLCSGGFAAPLFRWQRCCNVRSLVSISDLIKELTGDVKFNEPLRKYTSFRVGGKADILFFPKNEESLIEAIRIANENDIPIFIFGNGSNLLVRDGGIKGLVVSLRKMKGEIQMKQGSGDTWMLTSPSGINMPELVRYTIDKSLKGIETLIGIPGTLGGALKMNAGAEGQEIGYVIHSVKMLNMKGKVRNIMKKEISFLYRGAKFPEEGIFLSATIKLKTGNRDDLLRQAKVSLEKRNANQPITQRGAGSVFKNPKGHYAGKLIESVGLKGFAIGDAEVSSKHANFIINRGKAKAKDIEELMKIVEEKVMLKTGISLKPEIEIIGEEKLIKE